MTLRDLDLYLKRKAMAESAGNENEKNTAREQLREMEREHPGIRAKAASAQRVLDGSASPPSQGAGWKDNLAAWAQGMAEQGASRFADEFAGEVSGAKRFEPLRSRKCKFTAHRCAPDQVCLEIRARKEDLLDDLRRQSILSSVEDEMVGLAGEE